MKKMFITLGALLAPSAVAAQVSNAANQVSSGLLDGSIGAGTFPGIAEFLRLRILLIITPIALFFVVRAGMRLINSQDDDKLNKAKNTIASVCVAIMLAYISDRLVNAFYVPGGTWNQATAQTGASILSLEIGGIINWVTVLVAVLGILMIIASGLRAVGSFGKEDGVGEIRRTVAGVITGIGMLIIGGAVKLSLGLTVGSFAVLPTFPNASPIIERGVQITMVVLGFMALVAVAIVIYAGLMMVLNFGSEERFEKAKGIITRAGIGLIVILMSIVIVRFIANLFL